LVNWKLILPGCWNLSPAVLLKTAGEIRQSLQHEVGMNNT